MQLSVRCRDSDSDSDGDDDVKPTDADIHNIFKNVESYMHIVEKTTVHMGEFVSKQLLVEIIQHIGENDVGFLPPILYLEFSLPSWLWFIVNILFNYSIHLQAELFGADQESTDTYVKNKRLHATCKKALDVISKLKNSN